MKAPLTDKYKSTIKSWGWSTVPCRKTTGLALTSSVSLLLSVGLVCGLGNLAKAENGSTVPEELTEIIEGLEEAANDRDLKEVMEYYSPEFTSSDGLTHDSLSSALMRVWKTYPRVKYTTEIESWSEDGDQLVAQTVTKIRGVRKNNGRIIRINSTLRSRQRFQDDRIIRQEILAEQTKLTSGQNPPKIDVISPKTVSVGQKYNFDVIVTEPLGDNVLLGAVKEERTKSDLYLNPTALELEPLPAGGIYKVVTAPLLPDSNWLSAIVVRGDGITMVTQRVRVEEDRSNSKK